MAAPATRSRASSLNRSGRRAGCNVKRISVQPPNAVSQRVAAIAESRGEYLLMLDDDVVLEPDCVEQMVSAVSADKGIVGAVADFNNQSWPKPTRAWRWYMRFGLGMPEGSWQGKVVGPLLRFGYNPLPGGVSPMALAEHVQHAGPPIARTIGREASPTSSCGDPPSTRMSTSA